MEQGAVLMDIELVLSISTVWSDADLATLLAVDEVAMAWRGADRVLLQVGA